MKRTKSFLILSSVALASVALAQSPSTRPTTQQSATQKLDQMLNTGNAAKPLPTLPSASAPAINAATTRPGVSPGSPAMAVLREGTLIVDRVGRLMRSPDGSQVEFVFESDGQRMEDPPVIILPNLKLMAMEQAAAGVNRDLRFRITGMVTEYRSRNYVLLDKVVVIPETKARF